MFDTIRNVLIEEIAQLQREPLDTLVRKRREKFYSMGVWTE
jgi:acetyl-CoA carboxylase alpha subunit